MIRFEIIQHADEGTAFAPRAFDRSIGNTVPFQREGGGSGEATLISATVADDGKTALLTFDLAGPDDLLDLPPTSNFSIGW